MILNQYKESRAERPEGGTGMSQALARQAAKIRPCLIPGSLLASSPTFSSSTTSSSGADTETDRVAKLINDHPFPDPPLLPLLRHHLRPPLVSSSLIEAVLTRLFAGHANGLKALELFRFSLQLPNFHPSPCAFETTLHVLSRMRHFDKAWELIEEVQHSHPSLLTLKSLSILLSRYARSRSFEDTMEAFDRLETRIFVGREFGVDEFNVLLKAFCAQRQMMEARAVFRKLYSRFSPNARTLNILLLGFKESGNVMALDLFYHEMIIRGFKPDVVTYNIRIDAYCKKRRLDDALGLVEEMEMRGCKATIETMTTLIHGASIARNTSLARRLFDDLCQRNLSPDTGAYNALLCSFLRDKDIESGLELMDEMEEKGVGHDDVTYYTTFWGLKKFCSIGDVCKLYGRMVERNFVPKTRTVVMLMKFFCESRRLDLGLNLWDYMVKKGCSPHGHALDMLVTGLCCRGKVQKAYMCFKQMVERGRHPSERGYRVLEGFLVQAGEEEKLMELETMMMRLQTVVRPLRGCNVTRTAKAMILE